MAKDKIDVNKQQGEVISPEDEKEKKKKRGRFKLKLFMYIFLILLIGLSITAYVFNLYSIRQRILDVLIVGDQQYAMKMVSLDNEKQKAQGEQELAKEAKAAYEQQLADLSSREKAIADKEKQIEERLKSVIYTTENGDDARKNVIALFESMDAKSAAEALQGMNDVDAVASVLSSMKQKPAAAIMEAFDTEFASLVASRMLL